MNRLPPADQKRLEAYLELLDRYKELDGPKAAPWVGVRLLFLQHTMDGVLNRLKVTAPGDVAAYAVQALREMVVFMNALFLHLPPADEEDRLNVKRDIDEMEVAIIENAPAAITRILRRIQTREEVLAARNASTH